MLEEDREGRGMEEKTEGARRGGRREGEMEEEKEEEIFWLLFQCFTILHHFKC